MADAAPPHDAVVLAAMPEELAPLRALLADARPLGGGLGVDIDIVTGRLGGNRVALAVTGDGDRNARLRAAAVLALAPARALLAIGVAGALSDDLVPGELIAVTRVLRERGPLLAASPQLADAAAGARRPRRRRRDRGPPRGHRRGEATPARDRRRHRRRGRQRRRGGRRGRSGIGGVRRGGDRARASRGSSCARSATPPRKPCRRCSTRPATPAAPCDARASSPVCCASRPRCRGCWACDAA